VIHQILTSRPIIFAESSSMREKTGCVRPTGSPEYLFNWCSCERKELKLDRGSLDTGWSGGYPANYNDLMRSHCDNCRWDLRQA